MSDITAGRESYCDGCKSRFMEADSGHIAYGCIDPEVCRDLLEAQREEAYEAFYAAAREADVTAMRCIDATRTWILSKESIRREKELASAHRAAKEERDRLMDVAFALDVKVEALTPPTYTVSDPERFREYQEDRDFSEQEACDLERDFDALRGL